MDEDKGILIVLGNQNLGLGEAQYFFRTVAVCPFTKSLPSLPKSSLSHSYITNQLYSRCLGASPRRATCCVKTKKAPHLAGLKICLWLLLAIRSRILGCVRILGHRPIR